MDLLSYIAETDVWVSRRLGRKQAAQSFLVPVARRLLGKLLVDQANNLDYTYVMSQGASASFTYVLCFDECAAEHLALDPEGLEEYMYLGM